MEGEPQEQFILQEQPHQQQNQGSTSHPQPLTPLVYNPKDQFHASLQLALAMPPSKLKKNVQGLILLAPSIEEHLLESIDLPLQIQNTEPPFLRTEFNRSGDSFRSPHTNTYFPKTEGYTSAGKYRWLEESSIPLFTQYTKLYYGPSAVSSFYVTAGSNDNRFSCGYFAKKHCSEETEEGFIGNWDSFNIVDVEIEGGIASYAIKTTILIEMSKEQPSCGSVNLTGYLKKSSKVEKPLPKESQNIMEFHQTTLGELIEDMETNMRQHLETIYVAKTKEVLFTTRFEHTVSCEQERKRLAHGLRDIHLTAK